MSVYNYPYKDAEFILNELIGFDEMCTGAGLDEVNQELASAVIEEANRLAVEVMAPLNDKRLDRGEGIFQGFAGELGQRG